jgi:hypothetical protein
VIFYLKGVDENDSHLKVEEDDVNVQYEIEISTVAK